jgi:FkbM family methyltransferase
MNLKDRVKPFLQRAFGFHAYLVAHSVFVVGSMRFRSCEGDVIQFIAQLPADAIVLDIGANVGAMSVLFSRQCPRGQIYAFEPIPENVRAARRVLKLFRAKNVKLYPMGLSDRADTLTMIMPGANGVRNEGLSHVVNADDPAAGVLYTVPVVTLDSFSELRVSAIKIDVENHESAVFRGGMNLIMRDRPLIYCELWGEPNKRDTFTMLEEIGYRAFVSVGGKLERYDTQPNSNFLFMPPAHITIAADETELPIATFPEKILENPREGVAPAAA